MKKCGSCFRCIEDWKDARRMGLPDRKREEACFRMYCPRPRRGVALKAKALDCPSPMFPQHPACVIHQYRWIWNLKVIWMHVICRYARRLYAACIRVPLGGLRQPVPIGWQPTLTNDGEHIIPNGAPQCPRCGEMPYSMTQCVFCGQRFLPGEQGTVHEEPTMPEGTQLNAFIDGICPACGQACGNGGHGPLRCQCGWVEKGLSEKAQKDIDELFAEEFGEEKDDA